MKLKSFQDTKRMDTTIGYHGEDDAAILHP
jgi:hypothetical protein